MEPEGSLPHSQKPTTRPYSESYRSSSCPPSHFLKILFNIIVSSNAWAFQIFSFPQVSPPKPWIHLSSPRTCYVNWPSHSWFDHPNNIGDKYQSLSFSLYSFLQSRATLSFLGPSILLSTLFSHTFSLLFTLIVSDQVSHPYKTTGNIIVLYILMFIFLDTKLEYKIFSTKWYQALPEFILLLIFSWIEFWFVRVVPQYMNCYTLSDELLSVFILWFCPAF